MENTATSTTNKSIGSFTEKGLYQSVQYCLTFLWQESKQHFPWQMDRIFFLPFLLDKYPGMARLRKALDTTRNGY